MIEKLQHIDRRIIYVLLIIAVTIPLISPLGIPITIGDNAKGLFAEIESMQPGDVVLFSLDYSAGSSAELQPQVSAILDHLMKRNIGVVMVSFWDAGPMFGEQVINPYIDAGKVYGKDLANLGYIAGGETAIRNFGHDVKGTANVDFHNNPTANMPILADIETAKDFALVIDYCAGNPGVSEWVRQVESSLDINLACGMVQVNVPQMMPFVQSGQIGSILAGLRGAAEYELLMEAPGTAVAQMDAQSLGHLVIIGFIVVGNVAFLLQRNEDKKKAA